MRRDFRADFRCERCLVLALLVAFFELCLEGVLLAPSIPTAGISSRDEVIGESDLNFCVSTTASGFVDSSSSDGRRLKNDAFLFISLPWSFWLTTHELFVAITFSLSGL